MKIVKPKKFKEVQKEAPHCSLYNKSLMDSFFYMVFPKRLNYTFNTILPTHNFPLQSSKNLHK